MLKHWKNTPQDDLLYIITTRPSFKNLNIAFLTKCPQMLKFENCPLVAELKFKMSQIFYVFNFIFATRGRYTNVNIFLTSKPSYKRQDVIGGGSDFQWFLHHNYQVSLTHLGWPLCFTSFFFQLSKGETRIFLSKIFTPLPHFFFIKLHVHVIIIYFFP